MVWARPGHCMPCATCLVWPRGGRICAEARPCSPVATPGASLHLLQFRFEDAWDGLMAERMALMGFVCRRGWACSSACCVKLVPPRVRLLCVCCAASIRIRVFLKCGYRTLSMYGCLVLLYSLNTLHSHAVCPRPCPPPGKNRFRFVRNNLMWFQEEWQ